MSDDALKEDKQRGKHASGRKVMQVHKNQHAALGKHLQIYIALYRLAPVNTS